VGWLIRLERRLNAGMTRKEHSELCDKSNHELTKKLDRIQQTIEKQNEAATLHRQLVGDSLAEIRTKVAVLRERLPPRNGEPDDIGAHRRRL
jgi:DNA-binding transcriptional MerR regulator